MTEPTPSTTDAASPVAGEPIAVSLAAFVLVYTFVFGAGSYYILRLIGKGPEMKVEAYGDHGVKAPPLVTGLVSKGEDRHV